jgi:hypothetical protein
MTGKKAHQGKLSVIQGDLKSLCICKNTSIFLVMNRLRHNWLKKGSGQYHIVT